MSSYNTPFETSIYKPPLIWLFTYNTTVISRVWSTVSPAQHFDGEGSSNGLGNLADELGDWDEDDEELDGEFGEESEIPEDELQYIGTAIEHDGSSGYGQCNQCQWCSGQWGRHAIFFPITTDSGSRVEGKET